MKAAVVRHRRRHPLRPLGGADEADARVPARRDRRAALPLGAVRAGDRGRARVRAAAGLARHRAPGAVGRHRLGCEPRRRHPARHHPARGAAEQARLARRRRLHRPRDWRSSAQSSSLSPAKRARSPNGPSRSRPTPRRSELQRDAGRLRRSRARLPSARADRRALPRGGRRSRHCDFADHMRRASALPRPRCAARRVRRLVPAERELPSPRFTQLPMAASSARQ